MLGGLGALVPSRRKDVLELGMKSLIAGNIATFMTGAVAALVAEPAGSQLSKNPAEAPSRNCLAP